MTAVYLFCLIVGGGLLLVSLLGGDADTHADGGLEIDTAGDVPDGGDLDFQGVDHDVDWDLARDFFSVRGLFYLLAGFGATGLLLEVFTGASTTAAALFALLTGLIAAMVAGAVYGFVRRSESGVVPEGNDHLVGLPAQVVLPVVAGRRGKIRLLAGSREIELLARLYGDDDADCPRGATVVVVDMEGDTALVTPAPALPPELA